MQNEYDLVIIGSGAGGAPIAQELARKGKSVLMLEKGPLILPQYQAAFGVSGFRRDEAYSDGHRKDPAPRRGEQGRVLLLQPCRARHQR